MTQKALQKELAALLKGGQAHTSVTRALGGIAPALRNRRPSEGVSSVYEELEHMRIAQKDIFRYTIDPSWESPPWPEGYWPAQGGPLADEAWEDCLNSFYRDLEELTAWVIAADVDLTSPIPHGEGRTYLREILLVADHNSYHCGKIVQTRKLLGDWNPGEGG